MSFEVFWISFHLRADPARTPNARWTSDRLARGTSDRARSESSTGTLRGIVPISDRIHQEPEALHAGTVNQATALWRKPPVGLEYFSHRRPDATAPRALAQAPSRRASLGGCDKNAVGKAVFQHLQNRIALDHASAVRRCLDQSLQRRRVVAVQACDQRSRRGLPERGSHVLRRTFGTHCAVRREPVAAHGVDGPQTQRRDLGYVHLVERKPACPIPTEIVEAEMKEIDPTLRVLAQLAARVGQKLAEAGRCRIAKRTSLVKGLRRRVSNPRPGG